MHTHSPRAIAASLVLAGALAGCNTAPSGTPTPGAVAATGGSASANVDVGMPLINGAPIPKVTAAPANGWEPHVVPNCTTSFEERQQVSAEVDGVIDLIGTEWPKDQAVNLSDPNVVYHSRDVNKSHPYRRLKDGDAVKDGELICVLDAQLVEQKKRSASVMISVSTEVQSSAQEGVKLSKEKYELSREAFLKGGLGRGELVTDLINVERFIENLAQAKQSIAKAQADYDEAEVMLGKHKVRSHVNGFIRTIARQRGEFVKQGDKIMDLQATDTVRVEGNLDVQYASTIKRGMTVIVEPALPSAPERSRESHRQEVTGIAVTAHPKRPLVVSASADGSVVVWDVTRSQLGHNLPHPVPVRSVACTPPTAAFFRAVTGADDGKVRFWDLTNPDKLPAAPAREGSVEHSSGVEAIAFSPDGKYAVTAAGREIFLWETESGRRAYEFPAEHRDAITGLTVTPQGTLVSASRDRSIKVWKLGTERAAVVSSIDHRSGAVDVPGVSADGGRVLFDQDKSRLDLVNLADKQTLAQIQNAGVTAAFATFALFSPNDKYVVTSGGEGELKGAVQVWSNPSLGGRGAELARLISPGRTAITCAAYSPVEGNEFLVVGTAGGGVHLWKPPTEKTEATTGTITKIDATDPRYVTVRVELDNRKLGLLDRSAATVIINQAISDKR